PDLSLHAMGHAHPQYFRVAEALLPAGRRLCQDVPRIDGDHGLGLLRHRQVREVRELHGALRLRADRGHGDGVAPLAGPQGRSVRPAHRRADGAGNSPRQTAPGGICVLAPRRARTRGHSTGRETGSTRGGGVKPTLSFVIAADRDSGEAKSHPDHAWARPRACGSSLRRAESKARLRFRLTCVTRIFEKSVFTKFAHGSRLAAGVGERWVARASLLETAGGPPCAADHPFPPF